MRKIIQASIGLLVMVFSVSALPPETDSKKMHLKFPIFRK